VHSIWPCDHVSGSQDDGPRHLTLRIESMLIIICFGALRTQHFVNLLFDLR
jgi:hypothetical protein